VTEFVPYGKGHTLDLTKLTRSRSRFGNVLRRIRTLFIPSVPGLGTWEASDNAAQRALIAALDRASMLKHIRDSLDSSSRNV